MGKLIAVVTRCLSLSAVLLALFDRAGQTQGEDDMGISTIRQQLPIAIMPTMSLVLVLFMAVFIPVGAPAAAQETLTAPFTNGPNGATTTNTYSGSVSINVSGFGQAAGPEYSDTFYIFTDDAGNPTTPEHLDDFGLCINSQPVDNYLATIPPYRNDHAYQFAISIGSSPQQITFGVCDTFTADNSGSFTITVTAGQSTTLKATKKAVSGKAVIGGSLLYTIVVKNNSATDATHVTLVDKLPVQLWPIYVEHITPNIKPIMTTQGSCTHIEYPITITCKLGNLMPGEEARISYAVGILVTAKPATISNHIVVKSDQSKTATVKETVKIVESKEISDKELNKLIDALQGCADLFINYPFWNSVNVLIDKLNAQQITPEQFLVALIKDTLGLIGLLTKNAELALLSELFSVQSVPHCATYGRLLFSIRD